MQSPDVMFTDEVTADRSKMNSAMYRAIFSAHVRWNARKLIGLCFTVQMDNDPTDTEKETRYFLMAKKSNILPQSNQSPNLSLLQHDVQLLKTKVEAERVSSRRRWQQWRSSKASPDRRAGSLALDFKQSLTANDFIQAVKIWIYLTLSLYPNTFEPLKMEVHFNILIKYCLMLCSDLCIKVNMP